MPSIEDEVGALLVSLQGVFDGVEPVDELDHALQCAGLALAAGRDDGFVVACLLHDLARSPLVEDRGHHEIVAGKWLAPRFGSRVAWLAAAHVAAKQYLVASDPAYQLSAESRRSLQLQAATPIDSALVTDPRWPEALELRRCDDQAKVPGNTAIGISDVLPIVARAARQAGLSESGGS